MILKLFHLGKSDLRYRVQNLVCSIIFVPVTNDTPEGCFPIKTRAAYYHTDKEMQQFDSARIRRSN
jgi:hypothetical protein